MSILSINSFVAIGHVGNSASSFPLQRLGFEVWQLPSVLLSNHRGYETSEGKSVSVSTLSAMLDGIEKLEHFDLCEGIISGYLTTVEMVEFVADAVKRIKAVNPEVLYFCDPILGDFKSHLYISEDIANAIRTKLLPLADFVSPNVFELKYIAGRRQETMQATLLSADVLRAYGPKNVIVTSVKGKKGARQTLSNVLVNDKGAWRITVPQLSLRAKGTGDTLLALFSAHILRGENPVRALELATSTLFGVIDDTVRHDADELRLIGAQAEYLSPSYYFDAVRIG